jgi:hypothetical protein
VPDWPRTEERSLRRLPSSPRRACLRCLVCSLLRCARCCRSAAAACYWLAVAADHWDRPGLASSSLLAGHSGPPPFYWRKHLDGRALEIDRENYVRT